MTNTTQHFIAVPISRVRQPSDPVIAGTAASAQNFIRFRLARPDVEPGQYAVLVRDTRTRNYEFVVNAYRKAGA